MPSTTRIRARSRSERPLKRSIPFYFHGLVAQCAFTGKGAPKRAFHDVEGVSFQKVRATAEHSVCIRGAGGASPPKSIFHLFSFCQHGSGLRENGRPANRCQERRYVPDHAQDRFVDLDTLRFVVSRTTVREHDRDRPADLDIRRTGRRSAGSWNPQVSSGSPFRPLASLARSKTGPFRPFAAKRVIAAAGSAALSLIRPNPRTCPSP